jgi:hypothetical protein
MARCKRGGGPKNKETSASLACGRSTTNRHLAISSGTTEIWMVIGPNSGAVSSAQLNLPWLVAVPQDLQSLSCQQYRIQPIKHPDEPNTQSRTSSFMQSCIRQVWKDEGKGVSLAGTPAIKPNRCRGPFLFEDFVCVFLPLNVPTFCTAGGLPYISFKLM